MCPCVFTGNFAELFTNAEGYGCCTCQMVALSVVSTLGVFRCIISTSVLLQVFLHLAPRLYGRWMAQRILNSLSMHNDNFSAWWTETARRVKCVHCDDIPINCVGRRLFIRYISCYYETVYMHPWYKSISTSPLSWCVTWHIVVCRWTGHWPGDGSVTGAAADGWPGFLWWQGGK